MAERLMLSIPRLYADHHVQRVREILLGLEGVEDVWASAMDSQVVVLYGPDRIQAEAIREALAQAGYEEGAVASGVTPAQAERSAWYRTPIRPANTNAIDRGMAGDFRRY
ncbi:MAG: heavy-metal-associated domain-containing protein [Anaerolineae bacterium]|nr:heavy-metal-associated domain-containing protein [Anaerolineae bacterium]